MPQVLTQTIKQEQRQQLSLQQVLTAKLTELSVEELRARIETECEENPWLERKESEDYDGSEGGADELGSNDNDGTSDSDGEMGNDGETDGNDSSNDTSSDDDWDGNEFPAASGDDDGRRHEEGEAYSFHEMLMQQVGEYDLDDHQRTLLEYLIGSLDDDGLLRTPLSQLADELDIYQGIRTDEKELRQVLSILQEFEPSGVGARNLCECLLLQAQHNETLPMRQPIITMLSTLTEDFTLNHWDVIQRKMKLSDGELSAMRRALKRLNPRPGGSIGSLSEEAAHTIVPDFRVDTDEYGNVHFQLCEPGIPKLQMSEDPAEWMSAYDSQDINSLRRNVRDAIRYQRSQMERGNIFIEALAQRRHSMTAVMRSIIRLQGPFFREGDETLLKPMKLDDVAQQTGLDISTVSRVCRSKTVETPYGTYPLRWFFTSGKKMEDEEVSVRKILDALKRLVDSEDKRHPWTDDYLTEALQQQGYDVARRTVAKYREQLGIPNSRMRR